MLKCNEFAHVDLTDMVCVRVSVVTGGLIPHQYHSRLLVPVFLGLQMKTKGTD